MSFLRIAALWALPLVLTPIIIHLLHRRRHPTVPWAAMMFLRRAAQMRRGPAKLRRWLILAVRTLVVAAVVFAIARPLSSGKIGLAAGRIASGATSIVVLDRSPSMQRRLQDGSTRQSTALRQVADALDQLHANRIVLIDSVTAVPVELSTASALMDPALSAGADSSADLPLLLHHAIDYLRLHDHRTAEIWVCSDQRVSDWNPDSPKWQRLSEQLAPFAQNVRIQMLGFANDTRPNTSVNVPSQQWVESAEGRQLAITVAVRRDGNDSGTVPVHVTVGGVTSTIDVPMESGQGERSNVLVPGSINQRTVYGRVTVDADVNAADDQWYFATANDRKRPILLVTEADSVALQAASDVLGQLNPIDRESFAGDQGVATQTEDWMDRAALIIWQGELPSGKAAAAVDGYLRRGGSVVFFPASPSTSPVDAVAAERAVEFMGVRWGNWTRDAAGQVTYADWQTTLLSHCSIIGDVVRLSRFADQETFIGKLRIGNGAAWFCGADVLDADGAFVKDGVILFGLLADAIDGGLSVVDPSNALTAGHTIDRGPPNSGPVGNAAAAVTLQALMVADPSDPWVEIGHRSGVYMAGGSPQVDVDPIADESGEIVAINRPLLEDDPRQVSMELIESLVPDVAWNSVILGQDASDVNSGLVREIWGAFWVALIIGMLGEAWLCLPSRSRGAAP